MGEEWWAEHEAAAQDGINVFRAYLEKELEKEVGDDRGRQVINLLIQNSRSEPLEVQVEPLGMIHVLPPRPAHKAVNYQLVYLGPRDWPPTIEVRDRGISVWDIGSYDYHFFLDGVAVDLYAEDMPAEKVEE